MFAVPFRRAITLLTLGLGALAASQSARAQTQPFVTNSFGAPLRNNYTGYVGMKFTVGAAPLYVTQLGRYVASGNTGTHLLQLVDAQTSVAIPNGSVSVVATCCTYAGQNFAYASLPVAVVLKANTSYFLLSQEITGGDDWYDFEQVVTTNAASVDAAVYQDASGKYIPASGTVGYSYVPVNFEYSTVAPGPTVAITSPVQGSTVTGATVTYTAVATPGPGQTVASVQFEVGNSTGTNLVEYGPPLTQPPYTLQESTTALFPGHHYLRATATGSDGKTSVAVIDFYIGAAGGNLITGFSGTFVRNNYTGFVGMAFTVGGLPLTVNSLGRLALPGNNQLHTLKLVDAKSGADVSGGSIPITMTSGNGTTFQFSALAAPVTLSANTRYYLLSSEVTGGDTWYDYSPVSGGSVASIDGAVYNAGASYVLAANTANYSYVPVNLSYSTSAGATSGSVTVTSPANNSVFTTDAITFAASVTPAAGLSVSSVQFTLDYSSDYLPGTNLGPPLTAAPYTLQIDSALIDGSAHTVVAKAVDSGGNTTISAPVSFVAAKDTIPFIAATDVGIADSSGGSVAGQFFGMQFTVGSSPLKVVRLGKYLCCAFNFPSFSIKLVDAATGADVPGGAITILSSGISGGYAYGTLSAPVVLQANKQYYLLAQPYGQIAYVPGYFLSPSVTAGAGAINYPVFEASNNTYVSVTTLPGYAYAPVNFQFESLNPIPPTIAIVSPSPNSTLAGTVAVAFAESAAAPLTIASIQLKVDGVNVGPLVPGQIPAAALDTTALSNGAHVVSAVATDSQGTQGVSPGVNVTVHNTGPGSAGSPAFVTSFSPTFARNNYSGFVGFKFTVGAAPLQISSLGRICLSGNTGSHTVKLVQAASGSDLAGASVTVSMNGCTAGQFVYAALASPATLQPGSSFYLVDQETVAGDQWYDYSPVTTSSSAVVNGPVYSTGSQWVTVGAPGYSYVPVNFLFSTAAAGGNPGFGVSFTASPNPQPTTLTASVMSILPVSNVQFQIDGYAYGAPLTSAPYVLPVVPVPSIGTHVIVAVAQDSAGNTTTSAPALVSFGGLLDVIKFTGATLRNNFSGWVGFRLTIGSSNSAIAGTFQPNEVSIGRLCATGNSMLHLVKIVNASDGTDVPNAAGWINMAGCSARLDSGCDPSIRSAPDRQHILLRG